MAKKPGPKKGSKQRARGPAQKKSSGAGKGAPKQDTAQKRTTAVSHATGERRTGSRLAPLVKSRGVRNALAATLVSAAGALLFWKRRDSSGDEGNVPEADASIPSLPSQPAKTARAGGRRASARSSLPASGETDPLVAAGVAGRVGKKQSAGTANRRRGKKAAPVTAPASAEASEPPQALPGAYPDGSPVGDPVGRTSVEGGTDRTE